MSRRKTHCPANTGLNPVAEGTGFEPAGRDTRYGFLDRLPTL